MRIGIDARLWDETGVGRYIRNLVWQLQELDKKNHYVLFVSRRFDSNSLKLKNANWKVVRTDIHWHTLKEQIAFPKIIEKEKLDLVHFPYFSVPILYKGPFVITIHDLIINHYPTGKASTLPSPVYSLKFLSYKFIIQQAALKAQRTIAVSQATKSEIVKHLGISEDKVAVTYEGVESIDRDEGEKASLIKKTIPSPLNASPYFLYVGNAYPHKNLERLIEVFALITKEFSDVKFVFIGKEDYFYKKLKEKVSELNLEKQVVFEGYVSEEALQDYYHNAIATILPSLMEGFGLTGLEAMQEECLVLASDVPSLKEVYSDAAVYFDPLAVESMHATIREVLQNRKKFTSFIERGKKRILTFSWEKMAKETLKIYESSIGLRQDQ